MKNTGRRLVMILLMSFAAIYSAVGQYTETRQLKKAFNVTPETNIEIENKYGTIELVTWEKDSVVIQVKVYVEEKKQSKLDKSLDDIDFDFTNTPHYLVARTITDKNKSRFESELKSFKETMLQNDGSIEINYKVWLPATNSLKIENKFGDIYLGDYRGTLNIDLSNGKLKAHDLLERTTITLNFAGATINNLPDAIVNSNYSDLYVKQSGKLNLSSKSSEIELIESNSLFGNSRRDKFRIRQIGRVDLEANFSNFRISKFTDRANLRLNYGDVEVEKIETDFSDIYIDCRSTDVNLYFTPQSKFNFEIKQTKSDLSLDPVFNVSEQNEVDAKTQTVYMHGFFSKKSEGGDRLKLITDGGNIRLRTY